MHILSQKPLLDMGKSYNLEIENPIGGLLFLVEVDPGSVYKYFDTDKVKGTFDASQLVSGYIDELLRRPTLSVAYVDNTGKSTHFCNKLSLGVMAAISSAGRGEGAINVMTSYDATAQKTQVLQILFSVDLTMAQGAIPLEQDQQLRLTINFGQSTANVKHKLSIMGTEYPDYTNAGVAYNRLTVPREQQSRTFNISGSRFLALPWSNDDEVAEELTFSYRNGRTVTYTPAELLAEHLLTNDITIDTGVGSSSLGPVILVPEHLVGPAVSLVVTTPLDKPFSFWSLEPFQIPGIDPKSINATNNMLWS